MEKNLKILIIGFGSIGQRHFRNLESLGYKEVSVFDIDSAKIQGKKSVSNLDEGTLKNFDVAFVCNPNHKHIEVALKCAKAGLHLFIEKPLSHNLKGINKLQKIVEKKSLVNMVACNMRFHPALQEIKKFIDAGTLGKIYSIDHRFGQFLPLWRPGTDYRQNYAAKKEMGGGIVLDDIHEFDLLFWLNNFSEVKKFSLIKSNSGALEIETEDQAKATFEFKNGVLGSVFCDYLSKSYIRECLVLGEKGNLKWSWKDNQIIFESENEKKTIFAPHQIDLNQMYVEEIKYFLDCVKEKKVTFNNISRATLLLKKLIK